MFNACAQQETEQSLRLAKKVYEEMPESFHSNSCVLTSMLDVSMKCGDVSYAESLFNKSTKKELAMYAAMMRGQNLELFFRLIHSNSSFQDILKIIE